MVFIFIFKKKNKGISIVKIRQFRPKKMHGIQVLCNLTISSIKEVECRWVGDLGGVPPSCWKKNQFCCFEMRLFKPSFSHRNSKAAQAEAWVFAAKEKQAKHNYIILIIENIKYQKKMRSNQINLYCCYNISNVNDYEAKKKNLKLYHDNNQIRW